MYPLTLYEVGAAIGAECEELDGRMVANIVTDSREVGASDCFVAISGAIHDGHEFTNDAFNSGAIAAIVEREQSSPIKQLVVSDSVRSLGQIAKCLRTKLDIPTIAITGSVGKTSVKEIIAAVLKQQGPVCATESNYNNEIGLPKTIFRLNESDRFLVVEMGARKPGDIGYLCDIASPSVGVITGAGEAHLATMGSVAGVAKVKGELIEHMSSASKVVLNMGDPNYRYWAKATGTRAVFTYGFVEGADFYVDPCTISVESNDATLGTRFTMRAINETAPMVTNLLGTHSVENILAATAACYAVGVAPSAVVEVVKKLPTVPGRFNLLAGISGSTVIDDTYNANPNSTRAALETLSELPGRKWMVLGAMAELGQDSNRLHAEIGELARHLEIERLYCVGNEAKACAASFGSSAYWFSNVDELIKNVRDQINVSVTILVKGSRSMRMERVVGKIAIDSNHTADSLGDK